MAFATIDVTKGITGTLPTANGGTGATSFSPGKIGQVVQSGSDYSVVSTSTSYVDFESSSGTAWETAITPSATSSKILVMSTLDIRGSRNGQQDGRCSAKMMRKIGSGSYSDVAIAVETIGGYDFGGNGIWIKGCINFMNLISPNTTDAVTFKFAGKSGASGAEFAFNGGSTDVTKCTLLEVFA